MNILVTGGAGFIGFWTAKKLIERGDNVIIIDDLNPYYDTTLKKARLNNLDTENFHQVDLSDYEKLKEVFKKHKIDKICHLAAQAGVRYSLENPFQYERSNGLGTLNLLELCKEFNIKDFIFASSSSVYGGNKKQPFSEDDSVDNPISLYAATKKYNELQAHVYHHLHGINCTGLRFFTVYGPYGRPDMALFKFTKNILEGKPIEVYNHGDMKRDFTYIEDITKGVLSAIDNPFPYEIFNLARGEKIPLMDFIKEIETQLGKQAKKEYLPLQPGDVPETSADISKAKRYFNYQPQTSVKEGVKKFVEWYREFYKL